MKTIKMAKIRSETLLYLLKGTKDWNGRSGAETNLKEYNYSKIREKNVGACRECRRTKGLVKRRWKNIGEGRRRSEKSGLDKVEFKS